MEERQTPKFYPPQPAISTIYIALDYFLNFCSRTQPKYFYGQNRLIFFIVDRTNPLLSRPHFAPMQTLRCHTMYPLIHHSLSFRPKPVNLSLMILRLKPPNRAFFVLKTKSVNSNACLARRDSLMSMRVQLPCPRPSDPLSACNASLYLV